MVSLSLNNLKNIVSKTLKQTRLRKFLVAISGGSDSLTLLAIINELKLRDDITVRAIHINHNVSDNNLEMEKCCIDFCKKNSINLIRKEIPTQQISNIEEYLRNKRYEIFFKSVNKDEALVIGHHLDDQVETFFYRLFRGSSPLGLSSMKEISMRNNVVICRPLLSVEKRDIDDYALEINLKYIDDITNNDLDFQRNYIRKKILPSIKERWGSLNKTMNHNINLQDTYSKISQDYCIMIYDHIVSDKTLSIATLNLYPHYVHSIFIKYWIYNEITYELNRNEIYNIQSLLCNKNNEYPKYILKNKSSIVKYNNHLYIIDENEKSFISQTIWDLKNDIYFKNRSISIKDLKEKGIYKSLYKRAPITLKPVKGKEKIILNKKNYQSLKKIFQDKSIPVWERDKFILLFSENELLVAYGDEHVFISSELR